MKRGKKGEKEKEGRERVYRKERKGKITPLPSLLKPRSVRHCVQLSLLQLISVTS